MTSTADHFHLAYNNCGGNPDRTRSGEKATGWLPRPVGANAFTLVELLVVIGIIAILIGLLMPAVLAARRAADKAGCIANLHNLANAISSYEFSNHGLLVPGTAAADPILYSQGRSEKQSSITPVVNRVRICPTLLRYASSANGNLSTYTSYGWNFWIISWLQQPAAYTGSPPLYLKRSRVSSPTETVLLADCISSDNNGITMSASPVVIYDPYMMSDTMTLGKPDFHGRHGGRGSVLWMDLHVSTELAVDVALNAAYTTSTSTAAASKLQLPPAFYRQNHIGYLCRPGDDMTTMSAEYYFVFKKGGLALNDMTVYHNTSNKSAW